MKPVDTSQEADLHILEIDSWWMLHRDKAPILFMEELSAAFDLIARHPKAGKRVRGTVDPRIRRLQLKKTGHYVYYLEDSDRVLVVAVWGGGRHDQLNLPDSA